ncbi:Hydroxyethylthiazole kinase family-domain-containing protein [Radiomyces spectabilis]|uniref:Hydroxyethylthiazole kinase family-domain-containing protein n=1 Tax=Radiomyces spectabilis TaxID=64574 RepID=UPI0022202F33|nr:Hydroxyethylthiazole kinase family-domain-containing protein [Radiomyces spectabilis]KAI8377530.1 Hydroxyethylthiazole kinase family-domain-containing protein [Radiomyces spectabilis]
MSPKHVDYSLYLVTDSSLVPEGATFLGQIEQALQGGVTLVQLREKESDTGPFIQLALQVKQLTQKYNVPLIINDRLDVAIAVDADGVHIGQDDMPLHKARQMLGHKKIIGVSVNNIEEATVAIQGGADYLGIGAVWYTSTKQLKKQPLGVVGVQNILKSMESHPIPTVAIGGITPENTSELFVGSRTDKLHLDGFAIVSAIMASADPKATCARWIETIRADRAKLGIKEHTDVDDAVSFAIQAASNIKANSPMVHHITNYVVINDNANATLAVGASPIMSTNREEMEELAAVNGALVLNMGTLNDISTMILAAQANARHGNPVVLDPVGTGATQFRRTTTDRFLKECDLTIIKGNGGEILSMAGRGGRSRGVDSVGQTDEENAVLAVKELAQKHGCIVGMTGPIDYISDGKRVFAIENGDQLMPCITGSGCMATSVVACFAAANRSDYLLATVGGILTLNVASELAANRSEVHGPGSFRAALIDELYNITNSPSILKQYARIRVIA